MRVPAPSRGERGARPSPFPGLERSGSPGGGEADPPGSASPVLRASLESARRARRLSLISLPAGSAGSSAPTPAQLAPISSVSAASSEKWHFICTGSPPSRTQRWSHAAQPVCLREVVECSSMVCVSCLRFANDRGFGLQSAGWHGNEQQW